MKTILRSAAAAAAVMGTCLAAQAADIPPQPYVTKAPVVAPVPFYNWSGIYLGINGGGIWGTELGANVSGGMIGGTVGINFQNGPLVFGVEGDIDWTNFGGQDWLGTARARIGYAMDRFMPYITGGAAFSNNVGWTVGAGLEYGLTPNISIKAEYLYADINDSDRKENIVRAGLNWRFPSLF